MSIDETLDCKSIDVFDENQKVWAADAETGKCFGPGEARPGYLKVVNFYNGPNLFAGRDGPENPARCPTLAG